MAGLQLYWYCALAETPHRGRDHSRDPVVFGDGGLEEGGAVISE